MNGPSSSHPSALEPGVLTPAQVLDEYPLTPTAMPVAALDQVTGSNAAGLKMTGTKTKPSWICQELPPLKFPLVEAFYRVRKYKLKLGRQERLFVIQASSDNEILAAARLLPQADGSFLLRNMLVHKSMRGQGLGRSLINAIAQSLSPAGYYCFALRDAEGFYRNLGFAAPARADCAHAIQQQYDKYQSRGRDWILLQSPRL